MYGFIEKDLIKQKEELSQWYLEKKHKLALSEEVIREPNIPYLNDEKKCHKLDVYFPKKTRGKLPVLMNFHGGGFLMGEKGMNRWFCSEMARRGFLVFCIEYPLIPESDIYGILKDSYAGVGKALDLIPEYDGDIHRVFMCGDSAGAFISTYLTAVQNNPMIAQSLEIATKPLSIKGLCAISGMFYSTKMDQQGLFLLRKNFYGKNYKKHPFWQYVDPESYAILNCLPPVFCITSEGDYLREYTQSFAQALKKAGGKVHTADYKGSALRHDFVCMMPERPESQDAMDLLAIFFKTVEKQEEGKSG